MFFQYALLCVCTPAYVSGVVYTDQNKGCVLELVFSGLAMTATMFELHKV